MKNPEKYGILLLICAMAVRGERIMAYLYKLKLQVQVYLTYRFEVFANIATHFILILANVFLWNCVYSDQKDILGVGRGQMITYSVLSSCLAVMYHCGIQSSLNKDVREGNIALLLMKPIHLLGAYFAEDVGAVAVRAVSVSVPIFLLGLLFLPLQPPVLFRVLPLVMISYFFGFMILWLLSALVSMFTFVTMELGNMGVVKDMIVAILSGSMIPLWFFPDKVEKMLMMTPFPYTYQLPLGLYIGKIDIGEGLRQIGIQAFWMLLLGVCVALAWKKAKNKVLIQGG